MASFQKAQEKLLESDILLDLSEPRIEYTEAKFENIMSTLQQLAVLYIDLISEKADERDVSSSGYMQDNITPTEVSIEGDTYSISILAPDYASYQDEGVNGFRVNRGSRFSYKNGGTPESMVKSVKKWLEREGKMASNVKVGVSSRERRGMKIVDFSTKYAQRVAFMIKRQGIPAKHFWRDATIELEQYLETEFGKAFKVDIIENIVQ